MSRKLILVLSSILILGAAVPVRPAPNLRFDISPGGVPTITGSLGGTATGSWNLCADLVVNINFGELSPANPNSLVTVSVPIVIRSRDPYQLQVSASGATGDQDAVQLSDIGFGIQNLRPMPRADGCGGFINPLFNNDPASTANLVGRPSYLSSLANVSTGAILMTGPKLSKGNVSPRETGNGCNNGWVFDALFVIAPQFYTAGNFSVTLTFTISEGTSNGC